MCLLRDDLRTVYSNFAATIVYLYRTGTNVVMKAEEPFLFFIRHEASQLLLFYGAVFDPRP